MGLHNYRDDKSRNTDDSCELIIRVGRCGWLTSLKLGDDVSWSITLMLSVSESVLPVP